VVPKDVLAKRYSAAVRRAGSGATMRVWAVPLGDDGDDGDETMNQYVKAEPGADLKEEEAGAGGEGYVTGATDFNDEEVNDRARQGWT
jgi:hypothetical protein